MNIQKIYNTLFIPLTILSLIIFTFCSKGNGVTENDSGNDDDDGPTPVVEEALAFPGAEGFGQKVTGGRGGKVIKVTNLNDAGEGSLRAAISASGARIIVFDVSGTIELQSQLNIRNPHITLAGQTAPGDGITIKNYPVVVSTENVIIRYMRFRMGDEKNVEADALGGFEQKDIIIDHCSMSWSTDECVSFYSNENFTMQWCIISESLRVSAHDKGAHGYGGIFGGIKASFHHNLLAHHDSRNPRFGERGGTDIAKRSLVDYRNNVIYNWAGNSAYGGEGMHINLVNNYYKPGPATRAKTRIYSIDKSKNPDEPMYDIWGKYYIAGNFFEGEPQVTEDNWTYGVYNQFHHSYGDVSEADKIAMQIGTPHDNEGNVETQTAQDAYEKVLAHVGASLKRDAVDLRIIDDVRNKTYTAHGSSGDQNSRFGIIDSPQDVGGWPELQSNTAPKDSDGDGMPDDWEVAHTLDPHKPNANGRDLSTAYDNIEVYMNSLVNIK
ncbi:pectate lyase [Sphingobacterium arenae]|uniref:Pectate lyase n=1 Tax=Sphingobacterium arenae TaxID=1280598 RepID=A0ABR7XYE8_9SPHI|nr:pectate lyase [Sphingobacterium arenae]MBD1424085.1 pectate lyase [Sphingobacterium arenae]